MKRVKQFQAMSMVVLALLALSVSVTMAAGPLGTAITYQGRLTDGGNPANGSYDLQFKLFDAASAGGQIGSTQTKDNVNVASGLFVVTLDFGANAFNGQARYLEIAVRAGSSTGAYTTLAPRQQLNATPNALFSAAPWTTNGSYIAYMQGRVGIGTTSPSSQLEIMAQDGLAITGYQPFLTLRDANAGNARAIIQDIGGDMNFVPNSFVGASTTAMMLKNSGKLGLGTNTPSALLSVVSPLGTLPLSVRQNAAESATPGLATFETSNGAVGSLSANTGIFVVGAATGKALGLNVNSTTRAMTIGSDGNVGIGTNIIGARLHVVAPDTFFPGETFRVDGSFSSTALVVYDNAEVAVGYLVSGSTQSACFKYVSSLVLYFFAHCNSAAEYVPTMDAGSGYPETADVVSIVPESANPYGDEHGPFVVAKSSRPCDPNLLGFMVNPESGADGEQKNEHYLPLAIYGYFPAKVTTENGVIQRGDPLTSSSKPGHAMKATGACRIIGYALEEANAEGTIQVFANTGETAVTEVASLREQVKNQDAQIAELKQQVETMRQQNVAREERIAALEQFGVANHAATGLNPNWLVIGGVALFGLVFVRQARKEK